MKDFFELREAKVSAQFTDHTPDKDFNNLAKKHKVKVTHDKNDEKTTIHGDEKAVLSVLKTMYGNDWKYMYTKKGSVYVDESVEMNEQFVVKYAKNKRGPIYQTKFSSQGEAEKFLAQKKKEGMNGIVSKAGQHTSMQKMKDLQKESVELEEAADFEKMSNELLKKKKLGIEFEKAAAFARVMFMNSSLSVQDKAMKGLLTLIKGIDDMTVKTTLIKILKDNGFKVKGGRVMREEVEPITENYRTLATHGMGAETKNTINVGRDVDYYDSTGTKRMGKITKMTRSGYVVKDEKDGKSHTFAFHDRVKAKELLAKHGKGKYNESTEHGKSVKESVDLDEAKLSDMGIHNKIKDRNLLIKAIKTAEKMGGNMTGAVREIEKMQKGLSKHKAVQAALRQANESTE